MAPKHHKEKQILSLVASLALVIHHRILNAMIAFKMQRKRLLNLLLDGSRRIPKKSQIVNHVSTGFNLDGQMAGVWNSIRKELHHLNGKKIFA